MEDSDDQGYEDYHDDPAPQFTTILDLTNGEGGERQPIPVQDIPNHHATLVLPRQQQPAVEQQYQYHDLHPALAVAEEVDARAAAAEEDDEEDADDTEEDEEIAMTQATTTGTNSAPAAAATTTTTTTTSTSQKSSGGKLLSVSTGGKVNPNTPGKVVESGQEQTGRWTKQEHEAFLEALRMYGKEWKKVAAKVKTRTVVQTRTHAQKYFQKLQKAQENSTGGAAEVDYVDMGIATDHPPTATKPRGNGPSAKKKARASAAANTDTTTSSATSLSPPAGISVLPMVKSSRRSSNSTMTAAQQLSCLAGARTEPTEGGRPPRRPLHGFSTDDDAPYNNNINNPLLSAPAGWASATLPLISSITIVAPDPMAAMNKGKFPEPSPAATGKRKLAEIAAARMLAGVGGFVMLPPPPATEEHTIPPASTTTMVGGVATDRMDLDREEEGPPTPPPDYDMTGQQQQGVNLKDAPPPPLFAASDMAGGRRLEGLSLQIVNPEALGVSHEKRRKTDGDGDSPVTPWDGQLEALVNDEKANAAVQQQQQGDTLDDADADAAVLETMSSGNQPRSCHPVCGPGHAFSRSPLHCAVCEMDIDSLQTQLAEVANRSPGVLSRLDSAGYSPLHTASALKMIHPDYGVAALEMVRTLLAAGADPNIHDSDGNCPLHWAARAGDRDVVEALLLRNSQMDCKNKSGETALHWGMRAGYMGMSVVALLLENGARVSNLNRKFKRPADVAGEGFLDNDSSIASIKERDRSHCDGSKTMSRELKKAFRDHMDEIRATRTNFFARSNPSRTLVLHHPECLEHVPKSLSDWEAPDRVVSIMAKISDSYDNGRPRVHHIKENEIALSSEFERANLDLLSRVHSTDYLNFVQNLSKDLEKQVKATSSVAGGMGEAQGDGKAAHVVPFTPMVQRSMIKVNESAVKSVNHSDTAFSAGSLRAARRAAGAVQHAVDCVLVGRNRNAFCVVRPPGHHAGVSGLLDGGESCGFCIFNNVAAGALYAISDERLLCERCAIVDIDVHHGNGTEEIVRKCHDPSRLFFFSIHLYDNDKKKRAPNQYHYKFYPGTGAEDDLAMNIINVPIIPLWKEQTTPSPPITRTHNTRQKARTSDQEEESPTGNIASGNGGRSSDAGSECGSVVHPPPRQIPSKPCSGRLAYREAIQSRLLPALRAFNPDLILISAGFDAAKGDVGNARHERGGRERIGLDLEPEDYAWTTRKILEIADICCGGRVVSVLEGGYGRSPPLVNHTPPRDDEPPKPLDRGIFSECAMRHLHAMIDPYDIERRFSTGN